MPGRTRRPVEDDLVAILDTLTAGGDGEQTQTGHHAVVQAVRQAVRGREPLPDDTWKDIVEQAGREVGINVFRLRRRVKEVLEQASRAAPWLAELASRGPNGAKWVSVRGSRAGRVRVRYVTSDTNEEWISRSELLRALGAAGEQDLIEWTVAESAAPLSQMQSGHDADGHAREHMPPAARLRSLLRAEKTDIWVVVTYSLFIGLLSLVVPVAVQWLVNTVAFGTILQPLVILTGFVLVALGFSAMLTGLRVWVVELVQQRLMVRVSTDVVHRLLGARADAFDRTHGPELVNRFFDVVTVQKAGATLLVDGLSILTQTVTGMLLLAAYHPLLLVFDIIILLIVATVLTVFGRGALKTAILESKAKYSIAAWLETIAANMVTFKPRAGRDHAIEHADLLVRGYLEARQRHFRVLIRQIGGFLALQALASSMLLGVGGWLVIQRQLTLGQLVAAELVVTLVVGGLAKFGKHLEALYDMLAAVDKLGYLVDLPLERTGGESRPPSPAPAQLQLKNISFSFGPRAKVVDSVSVNIEAGERIGIAGSIGCGKSTLLDLLYSLRQPSSGVMEIDGRDYRQVALASLRTDIALVRGTEIFEGSVEENVRVGRHDLSSDGVRAVLEQVGLIDDIQALPDGVHTVLLSGGRPLSPGQATRLMLARALASDPRVLLIDELLDPFENSPDRELLFTAMFGPERRRTLLVSSSSPEVLGRCDRVYLLQDGKLSEASALSPRTS
ncbi:MAG: peptidase domain-containing ABC transporter [Bryobacteraceae bacterium]